MTLSDFTKRSHGPYALDFWTAKQAIPSPMGEFTLELQMDVGDHSPPDSEMLRRADELVALFRVNVEVIHDKVFEHYQRLTDDGDWLEMCGVPADLDRDGILEHLEVRKLTVSRCGDEAEPYPSRVYIDPSWDVEHSICLAHHDGAWEFVEY